MKEQVSPRKPWRDCVKAEVAEGIYDKVPPMKEHWRPLPDPPDAAISENAANALGDRTCASCGKTNPNWRYNRCPDCGELASSEVEGTQDSSVSGAGQ